jgi:hypothetical protein
MQARWNNGMVEYWDVDLNKEVTHLFTLLNRVPFGKFNRVNLLVKGNFVN